MSIRPYLDLQANRLESAMRSLGVTTRVLGGVAGPRVIQFRLQPARRTRITALIAREKDLALALGVSGIRVFQRGSDVIVEFVNPNPTAVSLRHLLQQPDMADLPAMTALLGLKPDGAPLLASITAPNVVHILVSGTTGSGKSQLLRAMALSLLLGNSPTDLQVCIIDCKAQTFPAALARLAHLPRPQASATGTAVELLGSLARYMDRGGSAVTTVLFIDELADLVMEAGSKVSLPLTRLLQRGRGARIHVIAATQRPSAQILTGLMRANFPLRLVGRVVSPEDARVASGRGGSGAHNLEGRGDFLAVLGRIGTRFQAPFCSDADAKLLAGQLPRHVKRPSLLSRETACDLTALAPATHKPVVDTEGMATLAIKLRPWLRKNPEYTKTAVVHFLFGPDTAPGGTYWYQAEAALKYALRGETL